MPVYLIVEAKKVIDKSKYTEYIQKVPETIARFGGKYLVRGGKVSVASGDWDPERLIIVEFGSMDKFRAWWDSSEYRLVAPLREASAIVNAVVAEGI
ncbi:MAG: DUF1330 domain-containing protein [Candidatus Omnitrophica bacterium]|nr:DUF1330 domain-containing protein [Candidatus Omnitrophota bacterium]MDD4013899.1 DUF1330 domain-containing protein [Candidatus Omnitrophota bacterium]